MIRTSSIGLLLAAGCVGTPPAQLAALPEGEVCYGASYAFGAGNRAGYVQELSRRGLTCDPAAVERERERRIHAANEQPSPYYYGGPP
jgi:hypothetical protein